MADLYNVEEFCNRLIPFRKRYLMTYTNPLMQSITLLGEIGKGGAV